MAHAQWHQGISLGRRAGHSRDCAGDEGASLGLQRPIARSHDRGRRRRPRAHIRHQPAAGTHQHSLARAAPAQRHGRRGGPESALDQVGTDLCIRVRRAARRNIHVPPACRRDDADGDGHDGILGDTLERRRLHAGRPRLCVSVERLRHRARQLHAESQHHARLQFMDLQQPRISRHRADGGTPRRARANSCRQSHHDESPDSSAWP